MQKFTYQKINTVDFENKRFYQVEPDLYLPSITTVLGNTSDQSWLTDFRNRVGVEQANKISKDAADRGTEVHSLIEQYLKTGTQNLGSHEEANSIFKSLKYSLKSITSIYSQEEALYSKELSVAGRCDLVGEWNRIPSIIDFKTSSKPKQRNQISDYFLQAAFYAIAHNEMLNTGIDNLVIMIGVKNSLPQIYQQRLNNDIINSLIRRIDQFFETE